MQVLEDYGIFYRTTKIRHIDRTQMYWLLLTVFLFSLLISSITDLSVQQKVRLYTQRKTRQSVLSPLWNDFCTNA